MAQNIITPAEVIAIAFGDGEWLSSEAIGTADISAATELWIRPIVGQALLDEVEKGRYAELKTEYIIPAVATCTRLLVQSRLNVQTSQLGLSSPAGSHPAVELPAQSPQLLAVTPVRICSVKEYDVLQHP